MKAKEAVELLRQDSVFWSKLGFFHDPPRFDENGKMIVFGDDFERFGKYHRDFSAAGIKIHTAIVFSGWTGVDKYDYTLTNQVLDAVFKDNKDIWFIPRIKLNVPLDWGKENPEDICVYYEGPREKEAIRALVNTGKHDILGYESPIGYYTAGAWNDDRPNVGGVISNQSFSSQKWLHDAGETLRRFIRHLEDGPYGERILGYHIAFGVSGETCLWGRFSMPKKSGDYGINNRKAFFDWGMNKYKTLEKLRKAWQQPGLNRDNCEPPPPEMRENCLNSASDFLRQDSKYTICIDHDEFMSKINVDAIEHFGGIVRAESSGKAVGCFYGYLEVLRASYTGWLGIDRLLDSPNVDFLAAPKSYYRCGPGEPGGELGPAQSVNRKKLWLDELDNRTHLCKTRENVCRDFADTQTVMWREFSKNMAHGSGLWWMDLGGGWFDDPQILSEIGKIEKVRHQLNKVKSKSISEVLLVIDENAFYYSNPDLVFHRMMIQDFVREIHLCGTPVDTFRLRDLEDMDLQQYKLICFLCPLGVKSEPWNNIEKRINKNATLMWNYYCADSESVCGFKLLERGKRGKQSNGKLILTDGSEIEYPEISFPAFEITNADTAEVMVKYTDGSIAMAAEKFRGRQNIFCTLPCLKAIHLRPIIEDAGCKMYAPLECTVYGDNRFIGVFPRIDIDGEIHFHDKTVNLKLKAKRYKFFIMD
jgi:hypothetical protein